MSNSYSEMQEQVVTEYLDQLCEQVHSLPVERQLELRQELRQHLLMLMADWNDGESMMVGSLPAGAALGRLVREFGDPTTIGCDLARQWQATPTGVQFHPWKQGLALAIFSWTLLFSAFLMNEMCRMFGWANSWLSYACAGPLIPLLLGAWWGQPRRARINLRWGYLGISAVNLLMALALPLPDYIARIELPPATTAQMCFWARTGHLLVWLLLACSACGVSHVLSAWNAYWRHESPTVE